MTTDPKPRRRLRLPQLQKRNRRMKKHYPNNEFQAMAYKAEYAATVGRRET